MARKATTKSTVDRKRSLAAKKGAATRARNREMAAQKQLRTHHKIIAGGAIFATLLFAVIGITNILSAYAISTTGTGIVGYGGKCLDNSANRLKNGNVIQLYKCNGTNAQKWIIGNDGTIRNVGGNYCLDVTNGSIAEHTYVQLYQCNGTSAQKFSIVGNVIANNKSALALTARSVTSSNGNRRIWMVHTGTTLSTTQKWNTNGKTTSGNTTPVTSPGSGSTGSTIPGTSTSTSGSGSTNTGSSTLTGSASTTASNSGTSTNTLAGNIAVLPDFYDSTWLTWNDGYDKFPVTWQGYTNTLQIAPDANFIKGQSASGWTGENEINGLLCNNGATTGCTKSSRGTRVSVKPGQTVTYSAYVWVTPSTVGAPSGGGFQFFMDVYGSANRIKELQGSNGCDGCGRLNVPYGSTGWTFVQMKFTVANTYKADGALGYSAGSSVTPTGIIPILQLNNWAVPSGYSDKATAHIRNTVLTVQ